MTRGAGLNFARQDASSTSFPFVDVARSMRRWLQNDYDEWTLGAGAGELPVDANGWPTAIPAAGVQTLLCRENDASHPAGTYRVIAEGTGTLQFGFDATAKQIQFSGGGEDTIEVTPTTNGGILMQITATDAQDPIRNIRVLLPGFTATTKYHPTFLSQVQRFGCIRAMGLAKINGDSDVTGSTIVQWGDRTPASWYTVDHEHGMPWEEIIDLCNRTKTDVWLNIPHQANDAYVTALAQLVRLRLDSDLRVYVEFSNEYWNRTFRQFFWAAAFAQSRGIAGAEHTRAWLGGAERALEIHALWMAEWAGAESRVTRVLAVQAANTGQGSMVDLQLNHRHSIDNRRVGDHVDALAGAPYFGNDLGDAQNGPITATWTVDQVLQFCRTEIPGIVAQRMRGMQAHADEWSLLHITYECGQHAAATQGQWSNATLVALLLAANRHVAMLELYKLYVRTWHLETAGGMLCWFEYCSVPTQYGSWGHLERQDQDPATAYKWRIIAPVEGFYGPALGVSNVSESTGTVGDGSGQSDPFAGQSDVADSTGSVGQVTGSSDAFDGRSNLGDSAGELGSVAGESEPADSRSSIRPSYGASTQQVYPPSGPQVGVSITFSARSDVADSTAELGSLPGISGRIHGHSSVRDSIGNVVDAITEFADMVRDDARTLIELEGEDILYFEGGKGPGRPIKAYFDRRELDAELQEIEGVRTPDLVMMVLVGIGGIGAHDPADEAAIPLEEHGPLVRVRIPREVRKTGGLWHLEVQP